MKNLLATLTKKLNILVEQKAKQDGEPPAALLNQIEDFRTAIDLTRQAIDGHLSKVEWQEKLASLNLDLPGNSDSITINHTYASPDPHLPYQSPGLPPHFVERAAIGPAKKALLTPRGHTPALLVLHGLEGLGKTSLAIALAHEQEIISHFKDGILWARLGPEATTGTVEAWQVAWGRALRDDLRNYPGPATKAAQLRKLLAPKTCLLVIDDAWLAADLTPLLVAGSACRTLITTRQEETAPRYGAIPLPVDRLSPVSSLTLLSNWTGRDLAADSLAAELVQRLGYLPLPLTLAGAQLLDGATLAELLSSFQTQQGDLSTLDLEAPRTREESLALSFDLSFNRLSPIDQRRLAQLGVSMAAEPFDEAAASAVWNSSPLKEETQSDLPPLRTAEGEVEDSELLAKPPALETRSDSLKHLRLLTHRALLTCLEPSTSAPSSPNLPAQYIIHPLLSDYTHRLPEIEQAITIQCHAAHYLRIAQNSAANWQATELALGQIRVAWARVKQAEDERVFAFIEAMRIFFEGQGLWHEKLVWYQVGLALAEKRDNQQKKAIYLNTIGCTYYLLGRGDKALQSLRQALDIQQKLGGKAGLTTILNNIRRIYRDRDDPDQEFQQHFQQALDIQEKLGDKAGMATLLNNIGQIYQDRANLDQALHYYQQALDLNQELGNKPHIATGLDNIGRIYQIRGELVPARRHYQQALDLNRELDSKAEIAASLWNIGDIYLKQERFVEAEVVLEEAVILFEVESSPNTAVARQWLEEARKGSQRMAES